MKGALLGECLKCTDIQKGYLDSWMGILTENFPELYRAAVAKYIQGQGIAVSDQDQQLAQNIFSDEGWKVYSEKIKNAISEIKSKGANSTKVPTSTTTSGNNL